MEVCDDVELSETELNRELRLDMLKWLKKYVDMTMKTDMLIVVKNTAAKSAKKRDNVPIAEVVIRQENIMLSPLSKKILYKKKSVSEITKIFGCT